MPTGERDVGADRTLEVGRIVDAYGVRGWVKIESHTDPAANILGYTPWQLVTARGVVEKAVLTGRQHGSYVVARLEGIEDRDSALGLKGTAIRVPRQHLPEPEDQTYYWADLEGLRVVNQDGVELGRVAHLLETGSNDVLVVHGERERLIPFLRGSVVIDVDLAAGEMRVDWDPEF